MDLRLSNVIEKDVQTIVDAARRGDLSQRVDLADKQGFYKTLAVGVNDLVDSNDAIISDTVRVFSSLAKGDLSQQITGDYQGAFNQLKEDANITVSKLKQVIESDIQVLVDSASQGNLSDRIDLSDKQGFFNSMSLSINSLVDSVNDFFEDASTAMDHLSQGDITKPISNDYEGSFDELKNTINKTVSTLEGTILGLHESSHIVNSTAKEIANGNTSLSSRTELQASALEETAASMEQLISSVKNNADNTSQPTPIAKQTVSNTAAIQKVEPPIVIDALDSDSWEEF